MFALLYMAHLDSSSISFHTLPHEGASALVQICSSAQLDMASGHVDLMLTDAKSDLSLQGQSWHDANLMSVPTFEVYIL